MVSKFQMSWYVYWRYHSIIFIQVPFVGVDFIPYTKPIPKPTDLADEEPKEKAPKDKEEVKQNK